MSGQRQKKYSLIKIMKSQLQTIFRDAYNSYYNTTPAIYVVCCIRGGRYDQNLISRYE